MLASQPPLLWPGEEQLGLALTGQRGSGRGGVSAWGQLLLGRALCVGVGCGASRAVR